MWYCLRTIRTKKTLNTCRVLPRQLPRESGTVAACPAFLLEGDAKENASNSIWVLPQESQSGSGGSSDIECGGFSLLR